MILLSACDDPAPSHTAPSSNRGNAIDEPAKSRALVGRYAQALQQELMKAMSSGGPVNAITVCSEKAPRIAEQIDVEPGWTIRRTSLKLRNPKNAPDAWEKSVLERFEKQKRDGADVNELEAHEVVTTDGRKQFRYMKAISTAALCVNCHGADVSADVASELERLYPDDKARGFKAGDIRGAFSVTHAQ